jgi:hypothetical protein
MPSLDAKSANMRCVLSGCENKSAVKCNNCGMPVCAVHGKTVDNRFFICVNCIDFFKKSRTTRPMVR